MTRLLILCEYPTLLGGEGSMLATLPGLAAAGFHVRVASPAGGALAAATNAHGVCHLPLRTHDALNRRLPLGALRSEIASMAAHERPALLHANSLSMSRIAGPVASKCGVASVGHLRDIVTLSRQAVLDVNMHRRIVAVSDATRAYHVGQGINPSRTVVSLNGIDLNAFRPGAASNDLHRQLGVPTHVRFVATIGQLGMRKGTDVALSAAARVLAHVPDVHWLLAGQRTSTKPEAIEFEAKLRKIAARTPLKGRVHFLGHHTDVANLLRTCVLLVHAARQEPLGRVLIESAASGLPVIATDVGGTREIFSEAEAGAILVPPDSPSELADAVIALLSDEPRRAEIGRRGRQCAIERFDIRAAVARLINIYHDALT